MDEFRLFCVSSSRIPPKQEFLCTELSTGSKPFPLIPPKVWRILGKQGRWGWSAERFFFFLLLLILLDKTQPTTGFIDHSPSCSKLTAQQSDNRDGLACKWKSFNDTEKNNENHCFQIIYTAIEAFFFFFYELNSQEICESCLLGQGLVLYPLNHSSLLD